MSPSTKSADIGKTWVYVTLAFGSMLFATNVLLPKTLPVDAAYASTIERTFFSSDLEDIINCKNTVPHPVDSAPIRSPQEVHSIIATKTFNRSIVEIGTRNGDGMACFAQFASLASAIEYDKKYCKKLEERSTGGRLQFEVQCQDFNVADLDADFITWWQQYPLTNVAALARLKQLMCAGKLRPNAEAILIFDTKWPRDMEDFLELKQYFSWHKEAQFDELALCERVLASGNEVSQETGFSCDRSQGKFIAAGILVAKIPDHIQTCSHASERVEEELNG